MIPGDSDERLEAMAEITNRIAHDFNNLLCVLIPSLEMAHRNTEPDSAAHEWIERTLDATDRCTDYTRRLLRFARRQQTGTAQVDANSILLDLEPTIRELAGNAIRLDLDLDDALWPTTAIHDDLCESILQILSNSRDSIEAEGRILIRTRNIPAGVLQTPSASDSRDYVLIEILDTGQGMPEEVRTQCRTPFYTTKKLPGILGLGLSTVDGFVKRAGGFLEIDSTPGKGTEVRLYLPRPAG